MQMTVSNKACREVNEPRFEQETRVKRREQSKRREKPTRARSSPITCRAAADKANRITYRRPANSPEIHPSIHTPLPSSSLYRPHPSSILLRALCCRNTLTGYLGAVLVSFLPSCLSACRVGGTLFAGDPTLPHIGIVALLSPLPPLRLPPTDDQRPHTGWYSGNYDYPPASRRPSRGARTNDRQQQPPVSRLQHLRELLNSERNRSDFAFARAVETLNQEMDDYRSSRVWGRSSFEQATADLDHHMQQLRERVLRDRPNGPSSAPMRPGAPRLQPSNVTMTNPEENTSDPSRSGSRTPRPRSGRGSDRSSRGRRSRDSNLASLLDTPVPRLDSPTVPPQQFEAEHPLDRARTKRRKLESDDNREGLHGFRYGQYGQVVPGALRMELASCDGGTYEPNGESSWPENVLRNDTSVYCTKSDRCNLVLKHHGESPFCLKKIVIKAPKIGYDAPIREGMVFVSMSSDELLARTAAFEVQYETTRSFARNRPRGLQPSQEYLNAYRPPLQSLDRGSIADHISDSESDTTDEPGGAVNEPDLTSEFRITTEYGEQSGGRLDHDDQNDDDDLLSLTDTDSLPVGRMDDDNIVCSDSDMSLSDDDASGLSTFARRRQELARRVRAMRRQYIAEQEGQARRRATSAMPGPSLRSEPALSSESAVMKPHARFSIERNKAMVSIKFDPPPSGRYILVKLWSPRSGTNIDIQSIIAYGYAGTRFFPALSFR
ncbi:uncharacterized protein BO80DRAFT_440377 [Aspergillus ibericus CBS 121593]|uniref:Uncharacterized protein n=1 Tax=Aspergillus ibericus CBS 121593 TaxID=1448316 RepID=A0A395HDQ5_9EURO|nr:hypothetical protein BO80DRAFT_440377 [Aspergillus ibericus CBS 121593]RAL05603.1 hypothetical protein BO80DRAFT_440377 [Aspergillus ibericus CBS 121593]